MSVDHNFSPTLSLFRTLFLSLFGVHARATVCARASLFLFVPVCVRRDADIAVDSDGRRAWRRGAPAAREIERRGSVRGLEFRVQTRCRKMQLLQTFTGVLLLGEAVGRAPGRTAARRVQRRCGPLGHTLALARRCGPPDAGRLSLAVSCCNMEKSPETCWKTCH